MAWNRTNGSDVAQAREKARAAKRMRLRGMIAGGLGVLGAAIAAVCIWSGESGPGADAGSRRGLISERKPSIPKKVFGTGGQSAGGAAVTNATTQFAPEMFMGHVVLKHTYTTNSTGRTSEFLYTDDGECHRINGWAFDKNSPKYATDQLLVMASAGGGGPPMPIVDGLDGMFRQSLAEPVEIGADDSAEVREMKERLRESRAAMKELMDGGMTFAQVLREHETVANENVKIHDNAQAELEAIVESGDMEGARKYCTIINAALQQMGVEEISMPPTEAEKAAKREARRQRMLRSPFEQ